MTYRDNSTAIGVYRTTEGTGIARVDSECRQVRIWDDWRPALSGWAAYDRSGTGWRITEAEAAAIEVRRAKP